MGDCHSVLGESSVLSEQIVEVLPRVSTASRFCAMLLAVDVRHTASEGESLES